MGAAHSEPREIVLNNPQDSALIQISHSVADRLKRSESAARTEDTISTIPVDTHTSGISTNSDVRLFSSSTQFRLELEEQIRKNNVYWEDRIGNLQQALLHIEDDLKFEYKKIEKRERQQLKADNVLKSEVHDTCHAKERLMIDCYKLNATHPLECAKEVEDFQNFMRSTMEVVN